MVKSRFAAGLRGAIARRRRAVAELTLIAGTLPEAEMCRRLANRVANLLAKD